MVASDMLRRLEVPNVNGLVVLLSGGLDSSVLTFALVKLGLNVKALTVLYGQRHSKEQNAAKAIASALGIEHQVIDLSCIRPLFGSNCALVNESVAVPDGSYDPETMKTTVVPNRNMLLLSVATAWSVASAMDGVAYAAHSGDHAIYPDCRPEFADAMNKAISICDYRAQALVRPFVKMSKADIVAFGSELHVPFGLTWSCYNGRDVHCGRCSTCVERIQAFKLASVNDPTNYEALADSVSHHR